MKEGDFVRHCDKSGHGFLVDNNGRVFVSNNDWSATVTWAGAIKPPMREPTDEEWARYCAWRLTR